MKGAFGNAFFGNWQTPWTRINNAGNVGSNDTGVFGNAHIIAGSSSTFGMASASQAINTVNPGAYRRRQNNLATYETPNLSGFTGMIAATTRNHDSAATQTQIKSRLWSFGAQYANGPLFVGAAYEKHGNFYAVPVGGSTIGGDEKAWTLAANYKFAAGRLTGQVVEVPEPAWDRFLAEVANADGEADGVVENRAGAPEIGRAHV